MCPSISLSAGDTTFAGAASGSPFHDTSMCITQQQCNHTDAARTRKLARLRQLVDLAEDPTDLFDACNELLEGMVGGGGSAAGSCGGASLTTATSEPYTGITTAATSSPATTLSDDTDEYPAPRSGCWGNVSSCRGEQPQSVTDPLLALTLCVALSEPAIRHAGGECVSAEPTATTSRARSWSDAGTAPGCAHHHHHQQQQQQSAMLCAFAKPAASAPAAAQTYRRRSSSSSTGGCTTLSFTPAGTPAAAAVQLQHRQCTATPRAMSHSAAAAGLRQSAHGHSVTQPASSMIGSHWGGAGGGAPSSHTSVGSTVQLQELLLRLQQRQTQEQEQQRHTPNQAALYRVLCKQLENGQMRQKQQQQKPLQRQTPAVVADVDQHKAVLLSRLQRAIAVCAARNNSNGMV